MDLKQSLTLYAITDARPAGDLPRAVGSALRGGATMVQLRRKGMPDNDLLALALEIKRVTDAFRVPLIINDNISIALRTGAAGVHLGPSDGSIQEARAMLGPKAIIGATARTIDQAKLAEAAGASYLGSGAVFNTSTKPDATAMPHDLFRDICKAVRIPVVAIGGIGRTNIAKLRGCMMAGFAIISGIFGQDDITKTTQELLELAKKALRPRPLLFDLFHTLVDLPAGLPHEMELLGVTREEWERGVFAMGTEVYMRRAAGLVNEPLEIIREMAAHFGKGLSEAEETEMLHRRVNRFAYALKHVEPEILSTLRELKERGHKFCIVSNADAIDIMHWHDSPLEPLFDEAVFSCLAGCVKPEPEIYRHAAVLLGEAPEACVFIGDGGSEELAGAKRLGMQTVQMRHFWPKKVEGAGIILDRFSDLLDCL